MDYLEIVLQGYFDNNNRKHLEKYFYREYKKAEKEHFEPDEFFDGCFSVVEQFEGYLKRLIHERKIELKTMLSLAKVGKLSYDNLEGKTIEQNWKETIEFCNNELKDVRPDGIGDETYLVSLSELTTHRNNGLGRIYYNMRYNEILVIKDAILAAKEKAETPTPTGKYQQEKQKSKGGRPKVKYKPIETFIRETPIYETPKKIAEILKSQYSGSNAAILKTMVRALENMNIWKMAGDKEIFLMLQTDFELTTGFENYRKCSPEKKDIDKEKISIQRKITKT
jgi:hypothetical protein